MSRSLKELARDDAFVKLVFEYVRNLGLIAGLLAVVMWLQRNAAPGWSGIWDQGVVIIAFGVAFVLMFLTFENLAFKVSKADIPVWMKGAVVVIYALAAIEFAKYFMR